MASDVFAEPASALMRMQYRKQSIFGALPEEIKVMIFKCVINGVDVKTSKSLLQASRYHYELLLPCFLSVTKHKIYGTKKMTNFIKMASPLCRTNLEQIEFVRQCFPGTYPAIERKIIKADVDVVHLLLLGKCPKLKRLTLTHCGRYQNPIGVSRSFGWASVDVFCNGGQLTTFELCTKYVLHAVQKGLFQSVPTSRSLHNAVANWKTMKLLGEITTDSPPEIHWYSLVFYREESK